jgi:hypothetical protein
MSQLRSFSSLFVAVCVAAGAPGLATAQPKASSTAPPPVAAPPVAQPKAAQPPPAAPTPVAPPKVAAPPLPTGAPARVSFGPAAPGTGSVTVRGDGMQVSFDGRQMGVSPLTITDVPKGDYIVEGTGADGKQVSRPVTIDEGAEATVDLGAGVIATSEPSAMPLDEGHPKLMMASKVMLGVGAAALLTGAVFGALMLKQHSDYESAPPVQSTLDDMARTGQRYATIANVSFAACGVSLLAAGALALPTFLHHPAEQQPTTTAFLSAGGAHGTTMAGFALRF